MLKVTFQFSLKITIDNSQEISLNVLNRCQSEIENALMTLWPILGHRAIIWTNLEEDH